MKSLNIARPTRISISKIKQYSLQRNELLAVANKSLLQIENDIKQLKLMKSKSKDIGWYRSQFKWDLYRECVAELTSYVKGSKDKLTALTSTLDFYIKFANKKSRTVTADSDDLYAHIDANSGLHDSMTSLKELVAQIRKTQRIFDMYLKTNNPVLNISSWSFRGYDGLLN